MRAVYPSELSKENPALFDKIEEAYKLVLPQIEDQVGATLKSQNPGMVAIHATFLRIIDESKGTLLYIEIQMSFMKLVAMRTGFADTVLPSLYKIIFYDTFDQYDKARLKVSKHSEKKYGASFPNIQNWPGGKNIGSIPDDKK